MIQIATLQPLLIQLGVSLIAAQGQEELGKVLPNLAQTVRGLRRDPSLAEPTQPLRELLESTPATDIEPARWQEVAGPVIANLQALGDRAPQELAGQLQYLHRQCLALTAPASETAALAHAAERFGETAPTQRLRGPTVGLSPGHETLLIVDDEPMVTWTFSRVLKMYGYQNILSATHGEEALQTLHERGDTITAVITDTDMPVMNGIELVQELRALYPQMPIVMLSGIELGSREPEERQVIEATPGLTFILKPPDLAELALNLRWLIDAILPT